MKKGLGARLRELFVGIPSEGALYEELEDALVEGDLGAALAAELVGLVREATRGGDRARAPEILGAHLKRLIHADRLEVDPGRLNLFLVLGTNGVGKTTTVAKLAAYYRARRGVPSIVLAAGDTFRAGAVEQLRIHGERLGFRVVSQGQGADPCAVVFDALESAKARKDVLVIADTAGRMHNNANLVKELEKIDKVARTRVEGGTYRRLLVVDATTGQNALRQAEIFHGAVGVDAAILAKYDATAKGGVALAISKTLGIPFAFVGTGEGAADLEEFDPGRFVDALLGA